MRRKCRGGQIKYLGVMLSVETCTGKELAQRYLKGGKVWRTMTKLWNENMISREVIIEFNEKVAIPTVVYFSEMWS